jgi:prolyl oligopeptidase PreP (S9A serine peptidase family)
VGLVVKKRKHCIILLLITRRRELPIHLKLKKEISSISKPKVDFKEDFESKQVFYTSKDGTKIPMIITYKKVEMMVKINHALWLWRF